MQIIVNSGEARSQSLNAINEARQKNYLKADELMKTAKEALSRAHQIQTEMIQEEIRGNEQRVSMIMVHAQDHLMNALTVRDLATEIIDIIKDRDYRE
ncbi:PTS lactose/cellobiose transporter subunit IIA [Erwinia psidii]|uniref:PTS lactose/cellobiose transporter subunit IIA n=2 Tax=Erwinia psidii TaxID=69224 RepID=A0A3N6S2H1_9GAMM|nr:PTS lactose/cellobiose transporter subunit IIA [Erwinia psidii]MCX8963284.1 PTS lactose/cellobiose transporter subunit IIA [Erwinia psidii]MCX8967093.1 PTS lactose/cellobiose transporter subunit IIA [Erwinia psidii]RQM39037.1 PTS lactose/cellobiose transporter subunit IIA [Erwinia psidii]